MLLSQPLKVGAVALHWFCEDQPFAGIAAKYQLHRLIYGWGRGATVSALRLGREAMNWTLVLTLFVLFAVASLAFGSMAVLPACHHHTRNTRAAVPGSNHRNVIEHQIGSSERAALVEEIIKNTYGAGEGGLAEAEAEYRSFIQFRPDKN
jgi:hypothetical protein